jgi:hypothetical protein
MIARNNYNWNCFGSNDGANSEDPSIPSCGSRGLLEMYVNYPQCWDGVNLKSDNFQTHMAYQVGGECPDGYPVLVPRLQFKFTYPVPGGPGTTLSSGTGTTAHSDFVNGWDTDAMMRRVTQCLRRNSKCPEVIPGDPDVSVTQSSSQSQTQTQTQSQSSQSSQPTGPTAPPTSQTNQDTSADNTNPPPSTAGLPENTVAISAVADAFVRAGNEAGDNFGDQTELAVKMSTDPSFTRETFLRFDLNNNGIQGVITSAQLEMQVNPSVSTTAAFEIILGYVDDNSWDETAITYDNRPTGSVPIRAFLRNANQMLVLFNCTDQVEMAWEAGGIISLKLYSDSTASDNVLYFNSRETGEFTEPKLIVTYDPNGVVPSTTAAEKDSDSSASAPTVVAAVVVTMLSLLLL